MKSGVWVLAWMCLSLCACHHELTQTVEENRTVDTFGGTCGDWIETTKSPATYTVVKATCGSGLLCGGFAWKPEHPGSVGGRDFNACLPEGSLAAARVSSAAATTTTVRTDTRSATLTRAHSWPVLDPTTPTAAPIPVRRGHVATLLSKILKGF